MTKKDKKNENKIFSFYKKNFKKLMIIPILMVLFGAYFIFDTTTKDGNPIYRDISLKGGLSAIVNVVSIKTSEEIKVNLENKFKSNSFSVSEIF